MIKKFSDYITERLGISDPTMPYIDPLSMFIFNKITEFHKIYADNGEKVVKKVYTKVFKKSDFLTDDNMWRSFPVDLIDLQMTYNKRYDDRYMTDTSGKFNNYKVGGCCYNFASGNEKAASKIIKFGKERTLKLKLEIDCYIWKQFSNKDYDGFISKIKSTVSHELNHAVEGWNRKLNKKNSIPITITHATYMSNKLNIDKRIWNYWVDKFLDFIYQSEPHELNAHSQELATYVKDSDNDFEKYKIKFPNSYKNLTYMSNFNTEDFIQKLTSVIKKAYANEVDVDYVLNNLKKLFIDQIAKSLLEFKGEKSRYNLNTLRKMTFREFIDYFGEIFHASGRRLHKAVGRAIVNK